MGTTTAAIYLRISLEKSEAITRQREACRALCEARGWKVVIEYVDDGVSASKSRDHAEFGRMLADARAGKFDVVVAWAADRLARRLSDIELLIESGVKAATVQGGLDLTTPEGEAQASMLATFARMEVRQKSERQKAANAQRAAKGLAPSGWKLFGWGSEAESKAVADAADSVLHGASLRSVCRTWNEAGHRTATGAEWRPYALRDLLKNPRIAGFRSHKGTLHKAVWEPLVTEETWRAVVALLDDPARRNSTSLVRKWPLSGLALCGVCGAAVQTGGRSHRGQEKVMKSRTYRCSKSTHLVRKAEPIEEFISSVVVERLSRPDAVSLLEDNSRQDTKALRTRAAELRVRLDGLAELVADGTLNPAKAREAAQRVREELLHVEEELADAGRVSLLGPLVRSKNVREAWEKLDADRQRTVLGALMTIHLDSPGKGARSFQPETVRISWI